MSEGTQRKTALITGASSGIGAVIARRLAREGYRVVLVARRIERLEQLSAQITAAGGEAVIIPGSLSTPADREALIAALSQGCDQVDVLINNAGLGWYGFYSNMPAHVAQEMIAVNVQAVAELTHHFLPQMLARKSGHIINISSIAGGIPSQGIALYAASKAFVDAFTTSLHRELRGSGVHASVVRPGPVKTEFFEVAVSYPGGGRVPAEFLAVGPEMVARSVSGLLRRPRRVVYVPWIYATIPWVEALVGWFMDLLGPIDVRRFAP
jgi:uncharacterized protein